MATFAVFFVSAILVNHDRIAAAMSHEWAAQLVQGLYWVFPKTAELGGAVVALVMGEQGPERMQKALALQPFLTTGAFGAACLTLACLRFRRKDF
jgi:hypothetical protein